MFRILQENYTTSAILKERKPSVPDESYKRFEQFYLEFKNTKGFNLISFYDNASELGRRRTGMCNLITTDGNLNVHIVLNHKNMIKLKIIFASGNGNLLGENVINRVQNLCQKYDFHLELYATPIHKSQEFTFLRDNPVGKHIKRNFINVYNPILMKPFRKICIELKNYLINCDRKTLDSVYGLVQYYKKFGFVVMPFSVNGFLSEGRLTLLNGFHMTWFNPNLDLKTTYPFWSDNVPSLCGSIKRTFTWKQSVEFVNWIVDNKRFELIGRNDDYFRAMILCDTQVQLEVEQSKELKDRLEVHLSIIN